MFDLFDVFLLYPSSSTSLFFLSIVSPCIPLSIYPVTSSGSECALLHVSQPNPIMLASPIPHPGRPVAFSSKGQLLSRRPSSLFSHSIFAHPHPPFPTTHTHTHVLRLLGVIIRSAATLTLFSICNTPYTSIHRRPLRYVVAQAETSSKIWMRIDGLDISPGVQSKPFILLLLLNVFNFDFSS